MSYLGLMNKTCTVQRATVARDAGGRMAPDYADHLTGVKCALIQLSAREQMAAQGWGINADFKVALPAGTDVRPKPTNSSSTALPDRLVINSVNYLVQDVNDKSGRGKTLVALVKRQV